MSSAAKTPQPSAAEADLADMMGTYGGATLSLTREIRRLARSGKSQERAAAKDISRRVANRLSRMELGEKFVRMVEALLFRSDLDDLAMLKALRDEYLAISAEAKKSKSSSTEESKGANDSNGSADKSSGRAESRLRDIKVVLEDLPDSTKYLDTGCSEGQITAVIAEALKLDPKTTFGVDVVPQKPDAHFTFKLTDGVTLDFPDAMFDLDTMFMSMHHFQEPTKLIAETRRVAKTGAMLIIREHDLRDAYLALWFDLMHAVYSVIVNGEETPEEFVAKYSAGKYSYYHPRAVWTAMLEKAGWRLQQYIETGKQGQGDIMMAYYGCYIAVEPPKKEAK